MRGEAWRLFGDAAAARLCGGRRWRLSPPARGRSDRPARQSWPRASCRRSPPIPSAPFTCSAPTGSAGDVWARACLRGTRVPRRRHPGRPAVGGDRRGRRRGGGLLARAGSASRCSASPISRSPCPGGAAPAARLAVAAERGVGDPGAGIDRVDDHRATGPCGGARAVESSVRRKRVGLGVPERRILLRHILPNALTPRDRRRRRSGWGTPILLEAGLSSSGSACSRRRRRGGT